MNYPQNVIKIIDVMSKHGYRAYAVGGCVRDIIMGREPSDWDMTTNASPEKMMEIFALEGYKTIPTGLKHGTVTVLLGGESYEITTFRIDGSYTDSRHPDEVIFTSNIEDDLARRDFTVNAMAAACGGANESEIIPIANDSMANEGGFGEIELCGDQIVDVFGGISDIEHKIIRAVGDPERRFEEDALRIMRAVRFAATLGFEIEEKTKQAAKKLARGLQKVSIERKMVELKKMLLSDGADKGINLLFELGLEKYVHKDIKMPSRSILTLPKRFETRMAALFFENEQAPDLSSLKLSRAESQSIKSLCNKAAFSPEATEKNARRMIFEYGEHAYDAAMLHQNSTLAEIIKTEAKNSPCVSVAGLKVGGSDLLSVGIEPRNISKIMDYLLRQVVDEPSLNEKATLLSLARGFEV